MSNAYLDNKLRTLSEKERTVLYWRCQGLNQTAIGKKIKVKKDMVKHHMACIYAKLLIETKGRKDWRELEEILQEEYCDRVKYVVENDVDLGLPTGENILPVPPEWAIMVVEQQAKDEEEEEIKTGGIILPPEGRIITYPEPKKKRRRPWWIILLIVGVIGAYIFGRHSLGAAPAITSSPYPTYTIQPTYTLLPTSAPQAFIVTATSLPTTEVPRPTHLPLNLPLSTPSPVSSNVFENKMSDGFSPAWTPDPMSGDYTIVNGSLSAQDWQKPVIRSIGDNTWKNYDIQISFPQFNVDFCPFILGVRAKDKNNMVALEFIRAGRLGWFEVKNGVSKSQGTESLWPLAPMVMEVIVNGDHFNWVGHTDLVLSGHDQGGVVLELTCASIDDITITTLP